MNVKFRGTIFNQLKAWIMKLLSVKYDTYLNL